MNKRRTAGRDSASGHIGVMSWRIVPGATIKPAALPGSIQTIGPTFQHESMPAEVAMLLPINPGPGALIESLLDHPASAASAVLGLFLASPFLSVELECDRLRRAGVSWITNLPSVGQQDEEFSRQLPDVGLDFDRELASLARFRSYGFRIAAVVTDGRAAAAAADIEPEAMIVMPRVADFAAGFPSLRQRSTAAQAVSEAARSAGWTGILLGLGEERDVDNKGLWPASLEGLVCRPVAITDTGR